MENTRVSLPLTNQKLWDMAKVIVDRQKKAMELNSDSDVYWEILQEDWFNWLEEELFGDDI